MSSKTKTEWMCDRTTCAPRFGLYTSALAYSDRKPGSGGELHAAALEAAVRYLRGTGEALRSVADVLLLLEQGSDDPCVHHCGDVPICAEHER